MTMTITHVKEPGQRYLGVSKAAACLSRMILLVAVCYPALADDAAKLADFPAPLSPMLPYDVDQTLVQQLDNQGQIEQAQRQFDILSWQAFIALNWPAQDDGRPNTTKSVDDTNTPRVWNYWRNIDTIFLPDGREPDDWNAKENARTSEHLIRAKAAWRQHSLGADENFQAFAGPLVDQNGKWVRYGVLVNHEESDYLIENELYNLEGQAAFSRQPEANQVAFPINQGHHKHGAIEIKLAWKELGPNDDRSRFFVSHITATLSEPESPGQINAPTRDFDAGLVGMHIAMHTASSPEWIWATFEQIDNVRINQNANGQPTHPNFYNPASSAPANELPVKNAVIDPQTSFPVVNNDPNAATTWVENLTTNPVQLARIDVPTQGQLNPMDKTLSADAMALNAQVQSLLKAANSPLQYYELIGTQWPVHPNAPAFAGGAGSAPESITHKTPGDVVPVFLINTTMETYFQKGQQPAGALEQDDRLANGSPPIDATVVTGTESCIGCHYSSGICIGFKKDAQGTITNDAYGKPTPIFGENNHFGKTGSANFSWLLQIEAKSKSQVAVAPSPAAFLQTPPRARQ